MKQETYETLLVKECKFYPRRYMGRTISEKMILMLFDEGGGSLTDNELAELSHMPLRSFKRRLKKLSDDKIIEITYDGKKGSPNTKRTIKTIKKPPVRT